MARREEYVKPAIMQLHYSTEPDVAIAQSCKTTGSSTGPNASGCLTSNPFVPCQVIGS